MSSQKSRSPSPVGLSCAMNSASCYRIYSGHWRWVSFRSFSFNGGSPGTSLAQTAAWERYGKLPGRSRLRRRIPGRRLRLCPNAKICLLGRNFNVQANGKPSADVRQLADLRHSAFQVVATIKSTNNCCCCSAVRRAWPRAIGAYPVLNEPVLRD